MAPVKPARAPLLNPKWGIGDFTDPLVIFTTRPQPLDAIAGVNAFVNMIGATPVDVVIQGENGTGKEVIARMIHRARHGDERARLRPRRVLRRGGGPRDAPLPAPPIGARPLLRLGRARLRHRDG